MTDFFRRLIVLGVLGTGVLWPGSGTILAGVAGGPPLEIIGQVNNGRGQGLAEVQLRFDLQSPQGQIGMAETESDHLGRFYLSLPAVAPDRPLHLTVSATKPGWHRLQEQPVELSQGRPILVKLTLIRELTPAAGLAAAIILGVFILTSTRILHRTLAVLSGAALILFSSYTLGIWSDRWFILSFPEAVRSLDFNVFLALLGLSFFAGGLKQSQLLPRLAARSSWGKGNSVTVCTWIAGMGFCLGALISPKAAVQLWLPAVLEAGLSQPLSPGLLFISVPIAVQLGGLATLMGSPVNLILGSQARLTLPAFMVVLLPLAVVNLLVAWAYFNLWRRSQPWVAALPAPEIIAPAKPLNTRLSLLLLLVGGVTIGLLLAEKTLGLPVAVAILMGAVLLILLGQLDMVKLLLEVSWPTLIYLLAAFILAAAAQATGLAEWLAAWLSRINGTRLAGISLILLWGAALLATMLEPILLTVFFLPLLHSLPPEGSRAATMLFWWAVSLGINLGNLVSLGGQGTLAWDSSLVTRLGFSYSRRDYLRIVVPLTLIFLVVASLYLLWLGGNCH